MNYFEQLLQEKIDLTEKYVNGIIREKITSHLSELFRKAKVHDPHISRIGMGMGTATIYGRVYIRYDDDGTVVDMDCLDAKYHGGFTFVHPDTAALFKAVAEYDDVYMELPEVNSIRTEVNSIR